MLFLFIEQRQVQALAGHSCSCYSGAWRSPSACYIGTFQVQPGPCGQGKFNPSVQLTSGPSSVVIVSDLRLLLRMWACVQTSWRKLCCIEIGGSWRQEPIIPNLAFLLSHCQLAAPCSTSNPDSLTGIQSCSWSSSAASGALVSNALLGTIVQWLPWRSCETF